MSDASDSRNVSEQHADLSSGSSPEESYYEGERSSPGLPKAATRAGRKRTSDDGDEDFVPSEATSKKKTVLRNKYGTSASTRPSAKDKVVVRKVPLSKTHKATAPKETLIFTLKEPSDSEIEVAGNKK